MADLKDFAEKLVNLTVKEVSELTTILKDEYGIEPAAAAVAVAAGGATAGGGDSAGDKKTEFPKYLSGGMTLIPSMKQLLSSPTDLIDIQNIKLI